MKFLKKVGEWGLVGLVVTIVANSLGLDAATSKAIGGMAEEASDQAIERHTADDE